MAADRNSKRDSNRESARTRGRAATARGGRQEARASGAGKSGPEWWVDRWQRWVKAVVLAGEAATKTDGRIKRLEIGQGVVKAVVQDRNQAQCQVEIRIAPWIEAQWHAAVAAIGQQTHLANQLLAGELPPELDAVLEAGGAPLLPVDARDVSISCEGLACGTGACNHAALIFAQLGAALADDPWLLLRMRGRDQAQVLAELRRVRVAPAASEGVGHSVSQPAGSSRFHRNLGEATTAEETPSLTAQLGNYWGASKALEGYRPHFVEPKVDAVVLRRLGPLALAQGDDDIYEDLVSIYRRVSLEALRRAFAADNDSGR